MPTVVGTDPGTGSLDLIRLVDGSVADQARLAPDASPAELLGLLERWGPVDLIAGPSGYGLPLVRAGEATDRDLELMSLVRPDERGRSLGVGGFSAWTEALRGSGLPVVFLPGGVHLPTIPRHRKALKVDLGTADKVAVAALALRQDADRHGGSPGGATFAVVEVGSAFSGILVVDRGAIVDASCGSGGPIGLRSPGAWDGEAACWLSPVSKADLFRGGLDDLGAIGPDAFFESLRKHLAGLREVSGFERVWLSGAGADRPDLADRLLACLGRFGAVERLGNLPNAWVKHSAQGSALLADGLAGGRHADLVASLRLLEAGGTCLDGLAHLRGRGPGG